MSPFSSWSSLSSFSDALHHSSFSIMQLQELNPVNIWYWLPSLYWLVCDLAYLYRDVDWVRSGICVVESTSPL